MLTALMITLNVANAAPSLQPPSADWSDQDPAQQTEVTDYHVDQTVTE
jgi:hypothetical protein